MEDKNRNNPHLLRKKLNLVREQRHDREDSEAVYAFAGSESQRPRPRNGILVWFSNLWYRLLRSLQPAPGKNDSRMLTPLAIIIILVIAFMLRGFYFSTYSFNDDFGGYAWTVNLINQDIDNPLPGGRLRYDIRETYEWSQSWSENLGYIYSMRYGMLYPMVFLSRTIGASPNIFGSYHLFLSLMQILCVFLILRKIFGDEVGLAGALMLAIYPMDMTYATYILPDTVIPPYMTFSLTFFFFAYDRKSLWGKILFYVLAGAFLALAYYTRVYAIFIVASMGGILLYRKKFDLWALFAPAGALLMFFAINYPIYLKTGTFLTDYRAFSQAERVFRQLFPVRDTYRYATFFFQQLFENDLFIPFSFLAVAGAGTIAGVRNKARFVPLLWFAGVFLAADLGSAKYYEYTMVHKLPRFMTMFSAPVAALGGILVGKLSSRRALFYTAVFLVGLLILVSITYDIAIWGVRS